MIERSLSWLLAAGSLAVALLVAAGTAGGSTPAHRGGADTVVVISIDGMRWDYPARAGAPALARMSSEGASCGALVPPFPSSTFPAHASLATGVYPDRHGIVNNEFIDRQRGLYRREDEASWLLAEPIWVTAERQGVRTAVYHWVFSYTPWHGLAATIRMPFSRETTDREKVDRIVEWLSLRDAQRPRLILSYLHGPDSAGHLEGPEAPAVMERVRQTDQLVERLLRALEGVPRSALVVVSDHGMAPVSRVLRTAEFLRDGAARRARAVSSGAVSNIYCPDAPSCDGAESALRRTTGVSVFRQEALPDDLRCRQPSRTGDLVAIAPAGAYFADGPNGVRPARGMHGYRPEEKSMQGIFRAWGAGVRRGSRSDSIRAVDVAPFVCRLLGIECPPGIDGRAPEELLAGADSGPASERGPTPSGSPVRRPPPRADRPVQGPRTPDYPPGGP